MARCSRRFGAKFTDNLGRMMRFERDGVRILVDYAHNPDGMRGLLTVAQHLRTGGGRLGTLLGQAGNRRDSEVEALARVVARVPTRPDRRQGGRGASARSRPRRGPAPDSRGTATCRPARVSVADAQERARGGALRARVGASGRRAGVAGAFSRRPRGGARVARRLELSAYAGLSFSPRGCNSGAYAARAPSLLAHVDERDRGLSVHVDGQLAVPLLHRFPGHQLGVL